jgi:NADH-quinone oxidoreductase subunit M
MQWLLAAMIVVPLVGGISLSTIPGSLGRFARPAALVLTGAVLAASAWLWTSFDAAAGGMQFELDLPWIPGLNTAFHLGVDGLALPMVFLTALLTVLAVVASRSIDDRVPQYFTLLLLLEAGLIGVFVSLDLILFYLFWEVVLIPMYFLISIWGGANRSYAALKFFIYTLAGSLAMLGGIIALYLATGATTFDMLDIAQQSASLPREVQIAIFAAIAVGLAVKVPIFPLHTWLPDAHVEAPTAVSVLLAGVLLKMGSYGFMRLGPTLLPEGFKALLPLLAILAVVSIVYGAAVALMQTDMKKLVAYSSISHMGYVMLGIAAGTTAGFLGAQVQMFSHGLIAGLLFLLVGTVYERTHTREISAFGGIAKVVPILAGTLVFAAFASLGLPGMSGFIGEFMVIVGAIQPFTVYAVIAAFAVVLTVGYLLWMVRRVVFGPLNEGRADMKDMTLSEGLSMAPLCVLIVFVGVYPQALIGVMSTSVEALAHLVGR